MPFRRFTVILLAAAVYSAAAAGPGTGMASAHSMRAVSVTATAEGFSPNRITADPGEAMTIELTNSSDRALDLIVELADGRVARMLPVPIGGKDTLPFDAPAEAGIYAFYAAVPGGREAGYTGAIVVGEVDVIAVEGFNFAFSPDILRVMAGEWVNIVFTSTNGFHDIVFWLDGERIAASARIGTGATTYLTFRAPELSGAYDYFCSVGTHRESGMEGTLFVDEPVKTPTATVEPTAMPSATATVPEPSATPTPEPTTPPPDPIIYLPLALRTAPIE